MKKNGFYMWHLKKRIQMNLLQNRNTHKDFEKFLITRGDRLGQGRDGLGFRIGICALRYMGTCCAIGYSIGNTNQYSAKVHVGKKSVDFSLILAEEELVFPR